jgi:hypothetical protein
LNSPPTHTHQRVESIKQNAQQRPSHIFGHAPCMRMYVRHMLLEPSGLSIVAKRAAMVSRKYQAMAIGMCQGKIMLSQIVDMALAKKPFSSPFGRYSTASKYPRLLCAYRTASGRNIFISRKNDISPLKKALVLAITDCGVGNGCMIACECTHLTVDLTHWP